MKTKNILLILLLSIISTINSQVVINEVMHKPGPNTSTNQGFRRKEYVEIYNKGCSPVNISCWAIGSANMGIQTVANPAYIGAFQFPSGTIINPGQHIVIGGTESQNSTGYSASDIDFKVADYLNTNTCDPNTNWLLPNGDAWIALYDNTGTPIDAIYWSFGSTQPNLNTDDDYASNPCVPNACSGITSLKSVRQIAQSNPTLISYVGAATSSDKTFSRVPDGGAWQRDINPSITGNQCNNGQCYSPPTFTVTAILTSPACSQSNGSISITPSPAGSYNYIWSPNVSSSSSATNLAANTYNVTITNSNGCQKDTSFTLVSGSGPTAIVATPTNPSCGANNGQVVLGNVTGGVAPYQYNFNGLGFSNNTNYSSLAVGSYTLVVKDANGCTYTANNIVLTSGSGPTAIATTPTNPSCGATDGQIVLGTVTGGVAPYQYNFNGLGLSSNTTYSNLSAGSYTLLVQDANGCTFNANNVVLTSGSGPTAINTTPTNPSCGATDGQVVLGTVTGGVAPYQYNFNGLGLSSNTTYSNLSAGSYTLLVQDANGCTFNANNIVLTNGSGPNSINVTTTNPTCGNSNGQVVLGTVTGGVAPYQYNFNGLGFSNITNYSNLGAGTFTLVIQDVNGCTYNANAISLTNGNGPTNADISILNEKCSKSNGQVSISNVLGGIAPYQYNFNNNGYNASVIYSNLNAGSYTLSIKDVNGCEYTINNIDLTNISGPTNISFLKTDEKCNESNGVIEITNVTGGTAPFQYGINESAYSSMQTYSNLEASSYTLSVKDANGCEYESPNIDVLNTPGPTDIIINFEDAKCEKNNGSIEILSVIGGKPNYLYSLNNLNYSNTIQYNDLVSGNYILRVKDSNNCVYQQTVIIGNMESPKADFEYSPMTISNESQIVSTENISTGIIVSYSWIIPNGTPSFGVSENFTSSFNIDKEGSYPITLIVENEYGCRDSVTKYVDVKIEPLIYVPNTFTPDGDNFNNTWKYYLTGYDVQDFSVQIFNRWGETVWESKDLNVFWDGSYNGKIVQSGVYVWTMKVKDDSTDEVYYYTGNINVLY